MEYEFTTDWFSRHASMWKALLGRLRPEKILEIGSFEGRSTTFIIDDCSQHNPVDIYCVDTWHGGVEHAGIDFDAVKTRFNNNIKLSRSRAKYKVDVHDIVADSVEGLSRLVVEGHRDFDLIYIDGSHLAPDVFFDAAMAFQLCKVGGVIAFDDYREDSKSPLEYPKIAIDAFTGVYDKKIRHLDFFNDGIPMEVNRMYQRYYWKVQK